MPVYVYHCEACNRRHELLLPMVQSSTPQKCPKCQALMSRVFTEPHVVGGRDSQREKLLKKQRQRKHRSRAHFKNEVLPKLTDPAEKRHFQKKFKNFGKVDHTKL